jgi:hypothetical protein
MGRPPGKIQDRQFQMRVSDEFLKAIDKWRQKQDDAPSRAEAIRRLVEIGLTVKVWPKQPSRTRAERAHELAAKTVEGMVDPAAPTEEATNRKRRLLKGPEEFREVRRDGGKKKN